MGTASLFNAPFGLAWWTGQANATLFISDTLNYRIRSIIYEPASGAWVSQTLAGSLSPGLADGIGTHASFTYPTGLAYSSGHLFIAEYSNNLIRVLHTSNQSVTTLCGTGGSSWVDGDCTSAQFNSPRALAIDLAGDLLLLEEYGHRIRSINLPTLTISTLAGSSQGYSDGMGTTCLFNRPQDMSVDPSSGDIYISEVNGRLRRLRLTPASSSTPFVLSITLFSFSTNGPLPVLFIP